MKPDAQYGSNWKNWFGHANSPPKFPYFACAITLLKVLRGLRSPRASTTKRPLRIKEPHFNTQLRGKKRSLLKQMC